jgi:hypothetical protein
MEDSKKIERIKRGRTRYPPPLLEGKHAACGQYHLRGADQYFLREYVAQTGRHGIAERAHIYQAVALSRMVIRLFETAPHAWAQRGEEWQAFSLLGEAAACLLAT